MEQDENMIVLYAMQGMLAHPKRYRPRDIDRHLSWHEALAREAYDIAHAMQSEADRRNQKTPTNNINRTPRYQK